MVFSSMIFIWVFLPILLILYFISNDKFKNIILLIFSLVFYAWGEPKYIFLMLFSIIINYFFGILIDKFKKHKVRKLIFILDILLNLGILGYYKYFNFFVNNLNNIFNLNFGNKLIPLPIGISFYTFQIMSYIIDLYKDKIKVQKNILNLALYISFFPQLVAGPIVKYIDVDNQIESRKVDITKFSLGVRRFIYGLSKKVLIANILGASCDAIFNSNLAEISTITAWFGAIFYTLQIYFDFSGYSDMAIGLGKMFGFDFPENFNLPYISKSITEFWRRWHISLSSWFKEYIYIPLGGNRKGKVRTYINLWIVFLVTGIWHGAAWNFVLWGLFHGLFIFIERLGFEKFLKKHKIISRIYTLLVVVTGWVLFRSDSLSNALIYLKKMFIPSIKNVGSLTFPVLDGKIIFVLIVAILFSGIIRSFYSILKNKTNIEKKTKILEPVVILTLFLFCIMTLISDTYNPFIYFKF